MKEPIFVVGTPRSGTTLTAGILGANRNIFTCGETHFFSDVYERRNAFGDIADPRAREDIVQWMSGIYGRHNEPEDQRELDRILCDPEKKAHFMEATSYRELYSRLMEYRMAPSGKTRWGNHVPKDIYHVDEIFDFFPDAKLIVCIRDIRDFLSSYRARLLRNERKDDTVPERSRTRVKLYHPVITSLLWKSTARLITRLRHQIPSERLLLLRYEDLVAEPEVQVHRICDYLDEPYSKDMLDVTGHNSSAAVQGGQGIFTSSVGRWRKDLDPEAVYIAQKIAGAEMKTFGYEPSAVSANWAKVGGLMTTVPVAGLQALRESRTDRGGLLPYVRKRVMPYRYRRA